MTLSPDTSYKMVFILGAPRSGTTMLEHMLSSNSRAKGGAEPHLLTPLAHLGYWRRVDKAPYDYIVSALGQRAFVDALPHQAQDYWRACRAYCDTLYSAHMSTGTGKETLCIDKTPEYTTIWPFIFKVFPDARFIILTRHPGAIFTSFANSFFDGDFAAAQQHDAILERYIPALAGILRQNETAYHHLRYEDLVTVPEQSLRKLCEYLTIPYEDSMVAYGNKANQRAAGAGLGDPVGVKQQTRPSSKGIDQWANELASDDNKLLLFKQSIARISDDDLALIGYPADTLFTPLEQAGGNISNKKRRGGSLSWRVQRKLIVRGRKLAQRYRVVHAALTWLRMACDVLIREY